MEKFQDYVTDFAERLDTVSGVYPTTPLFILGHSMGANIAVAYAVNPSFAKPSSLRGFIFSGLATEISPDTANPTTLLLLRTFSSTLPKMPISFLESDFLSRNVTEREEYFSDPSMLSHVLAHFSREFLLSAFSLSESFANFTFPFLATHGVNDRIANVTASIRLYEESPSTDKQLLLLDGFEHEPFADPERGKWEEAVMTWYMQRLGSIPS